MRGRLGHARMGAMHARFQLLDEEVGWVLFAVLWLPQVVGITWAEMFRGSPDLAWWLVVTLVLSAATAVARGRRLTDGRMDD